MLVPSMWSKPETSIGSKYVIFVIDTCQPRAMTRTKTIFTVRLGDHRVEIVELILTNERPNHLKREPWSDGGLIKERRLLAQYA